MNKDFPPISDQVVSATKSVVKLINKVAHGSDVIAPRSVITERWVICKECPSDQYKNRRCKACGCALSVKILFHIFECPLGYWGKYEVKTPFTNVSETEDFHD